MLDKLASVRVSREEEHLKSFDAHRKFEKKRGEENLLNPGGESISALDTTTPLLHLGGRN